jgi:hypothetical protein
MEVEDGGWRVVGAGHSPEPKREDAKESVRR